MGYVQCAAYTVKFLYFFDHKKSQYAPVQRTKKRTNTPFKRTSEKAISGNPIYNGKRPSKGVIGDPWLQITAAGSFRAHLALIQLGQQREEREDLPRGLILTPASPKIPRQKTFLLQNRIK